MKQTYYKHKIENLLSVNKIVTIHYFEFEKNFVSKMESHDFWEIVYADKSSILCLSDNSEIILNEGEMLFHKPNEKHGIRSNGKSASNVFIISFVCKSESIRFFENKKIALSSQFKKYIYSIIDEGKKTFDFPYSDPETKKLPLKKHPTLGGQQLIKNLLEILLINIMREETKQDGSTSTFLFKEEYDNLIANKIIDYLNDNLNKNININDIAKELNYNKSYLFRQFKLVTGKTILHYYVNLKIEDAKKQLREKNISVKELAEYYAFDTPNYFSKTFKKYTGYTPLQYKKLNKFS